jgi:hypothetical protein
VNSRENSALNAPTLAGLCLGYLAENPEELVRFMDVSGYDPASLRAAVSSRDLSAGLIDYFAQNEPLLLAFCANAGITPERFMGVWQKLNPAG